MSRSLTTTLFVLAFMGWGPSSALALTHPARADAPPAQGTAAPESPRAPSGPPLLGPGGEGEAERGAEEPSGSQPEADPLVGNGLGSPSCSSMLLSELARTSRRDCETSGFVASAAPTGGYGIDVHIDTGLFGISSGLLQSIVQDLFVTPLWLALVWAVHALIVMLEWSFSIDLLEGGPGSAASSGLARLEKALTAPWLALTLSVAAVLAAYHGLVRRRVADTLGEVLLMGAMIGGGLWLILDPAATVGTLSQWSDEAGLGTLAVTVRGSPATPGEALGSSMSGLFATTIEGPWCYLEFGDVDWCRAPERLDPRLRTAGLKIAQQQVARSGCGSSAGCAREGTGAASAQSLTASARLLREARTNGALFLALPANGPARNSINETSSLLRVLCQSAEATSCRGATAAQAEFRTGGGTWPRVGGLLLIAGGLAGMMLLIGYIALRLLMAAILSLFYLLLAPGIVLAPALGAHGRSVFRGWAGRLFAAVISKLIFAFLLGVVLSVMVVLEGLTALGWWARWLLLSAFWWGTFTRRDQLVQAARRPDAAPQRAVRRSAVRRVDDGVQRVRSVRERRRQKKRAQEAERLKQRAPETRQLPSGSGMPLSRRGPIRGPAGRVQRRDGGGQSERLRQLRERLTQREGQLARIEQAEAGAVGSGDRRRAAVLAVRRQLVEDEIQADRRAVDREVGGLPGPNTAGAVVADRIRQSSFIEEQARLPPARLVRAGEPGRDYPALAELAGYRLGEYERLGPGPQRAARVEIDRELAIRRGAVSRRGEPEPVLDVPGRPGRGDEPLARAPIQPTRRAGGAPGSAGGSGSAEPPESSVMRDAREVAAGRKRQLGIGRP